MRRRHLAAVVFAASIVAAGSARAQATGERVERDGVLHVLDPRDPPEVVSYSLDELWRRGEDDDEIVFGAVTQLVGDAEGNVYLLDAQTSRVLVFSSMGKHLRTMGRRGEAPGELNGYARDLFLGPEGRLGIAQGYPPRIVQMTLTGSPLDDFALERSLEGLPMLAAARGNADGVALLLLRSRRDGAQQRIARTLVSFDGNGRAVARFCEEEIERNAEAPKLDEKTYDGFTSRWALADDGRVAAARDFDAYRIQVWNPDGTVDRVLEHEEHAPLPRSEREMALARERGEAWTAGWKNAEFVVSRTHAAVQRLWFRPGGELWVLSDRGRFAPGEDLYASIDVHAPDGRFLRRMRLRMHGGDSLEDGIYFVGDHVYRLTSQLSAITALIGEGAQASSHGSARPMTLVAYRLRRLPD